VVVSHGDFAPHNVLRTDRGLVLIDFDRLQMAPRERDLAYWGAYLWVKALLAGSTPSWQHGDDLADHYQETSGQPTDHRSYRFHRAAALLRIGLGRSAMRDHPDLASPRIDRSLSITRR
jgi:aminoglycoside phosphotransferase (APT) family kinase protein